MKENENACPNCHPSFSLCSWWAFIYLNIIVCLFQVAFWFCSDTALSINYMCQLENHIPWIYILFILELNDLFACDIVLLCALELSTGTRFATRSQASFSFDSYPPYTRFYSLVNEESLFYFPEQVLSWLELGVGFLLVARWKLTGIMFNCIFLVIHWACFRCFSISCILYRKWKFIICIISLSFHSNIANCISNVVYIFIEVLSEMTLLCPLPIS